MLQRVWLKGVSCQAISPCSGLQQMMTCVLPGACSVMPCSPKADQMWTKQWTHAGMQSRWCGEPAGLASSRHQGNIHGLTCLMCTCCHSKVSLAYARQRVE